MIRKFFRHKFTKIFIAIHVAILLFLVGLFFYFKTKSGDAYNKALANVPYDVIIVPGYPFMGDNWHDIMRTRVYWSKYLIENGYTQHVIYSGSAVYSPYTESVVMKLYAIALGIPADKIFTETRAEHSTENLIYSYRLARAQGFEKIALATDPIQSVLLMMYAEDKVNDVKYLPIRYRLLDSVYEKDPVIDPSTAYVDDFIALPERESFFERLRGTMGEGIVFESKRIN
ncbi:hypothetical protein C900_02903 [Fulvivirga imtechensis AK7]|uniref:DUF218 domain-containing protein n=1 Tax=Fulvivirga imtechensis AK7 TaxID=1237149 RepID=L8JSY0_9BACT|nr:YdcF family protein [Fulvivirga imtechensis]ELR71288.1 hypothetical protein C900_02903 [Fulvivirga imtechensis AK7]